VLEIIIPEWIIYGTGGALASCICLFMLFLVLFLIGYKLKSREEK
jgi:hypothetical protein